MLMMVGLIMKANGAPRKQLMWSRDQTIGFMENQLLDNYSRKILNERTRLILTTFRYLCDIVALSLSQTNSHIRTCIPIETQ